MNIVKIKSVFFHSVSMFLRRNSNKIGLLFVRKTLNEGEGSVGQAD